MNLIFHILGTIIPFDFHIFQRGRYTTNQVLKACPLSGLTHLHLDSLGQEMLGVSSS